MKQVSFNSEKGFIALFLKSWGMIVFCLSCFAFYAHASINKKQQYNTLKHQLEELEVRLHFQKDKNEDLNLRIASQMDKEWVELLLMKHLGVVPEGKTKVYFNSKMK